TMPGRYSAQPTALMLVGTIRSPAVSWNARRSSLFRFFGPAPLASAIDHGAHGGAAAPARRREDAGGGGAERFPRPRAPGGVPAKRATRKSKKARAARGGWGRGGCPDLPARSPSSC